jgi:hypothetical protein
MIEYLYDYYAFDYTLADYAKDLVTTYNEQGDKLLPPK